MPDKFKLEENISLLKVGKNKNKSEDGEQIYNKSKTGYRRIIK